MAASDAAVEGISGAVGAMIACVSTYPLMAISTQQAVNRTSQEADCEGFQKRGAISELLQIVQTRGWRGLFPGLQAALLGTGVSQGVYFYLYSLLRKAAVERQYAAGLKGTAAQDIGIAGSLLVASLAGCGNVILTNPFWVLVTHMQTRKQEDDDDTPKGPLAVSKSIYDEGGILGFWKGVFPTLVMVTNPTAQYMIYEWLKARLAEYKTKGKLRKHSRETASEIFLMSAVAKLGATLATYPMLLVKSRLQAADMDQQYNGTLDAIQKIYASEGLEGFYKGMKTKIVQSVLAAALLFMLKEKITAGVRKALRS